MPNISNNQPSRKPEPEKEIPQTGQRREIFRVFVVISNIGLVMFFSIITGFFIGIWLDKIFRKDYIFLIVFIIAGICAGFYQCYRILKKELNI
ncbi:AtpZ/AtpI family protein [bacterium]|nr:AtpZ/AtpI family protein [bacterium]MCP5463037.1 AtpZ/AtpI family protein [bacterium]